MNRRALRRSFLPVAFFVLADVPAEAAVAPAPPPERTAEPADPGQAPGPSLFPETAWGAAWRAEGEAVSERLASGHAAEAVALAGEVKQRIEAAIRSGTPPERVPLAALRLEVERLEGIAEAATRGLGVAASARPTDIADGSAPEAKSLPGLLEGLTLKGVISRYVDYYSGPGRRGFEITRAKRADSWKWMEEILEEEGVPTSLACVSLVESGINPEAVSPHRAVGQWQFLAGTARRFGLTVDRWIDERKDPELSTRAAARYLKYLYGMFRSWPLALAAYNAGEGTIQRAIRSQGTDDFFELRLPQQTQEFVGRCLASMWVDQNADRLGITPRTGSRPNFSHMVVRSSTPLHSVARFHGTSPEVLRALNPALRRGATPPGAGAYAVRVPAEAHDPGTVADAPEPAAPEPADLAGLAPVEGRAAKDAASETASAASERPPVHRVRKGETLFSIARRNGITVAAIRALNPKLAGDHLAVGQRLALPPSPKPSR